MCNGNEKNRKGIEKEKEIVNDKTHRNHFETLAEEIGTKRRMGRRLRNGISSPVLQPPTDKTRIYPRGSVAINSDQRG